MQNKPNFRNDKMNINTLITMRYGNLGTLDGCKNKAKTNPIKANTKPIQTQFNPIQSQFNPIQTQFNERGKNESFCVDKELKNDIL
jgi:hypothetical protein